jgi:hypothetical protein
MKVCCLNNVSLPQSLLLEFFLTFARFEFALKNSGFVTGDHSEARPNWDQFGRSLDLATARNDQTFAVAQDFLAFNHPARQVLVNGDLAWDISIPFTHLERMDQILTLVRRVRNNLFHGGQFGNDTHSSSVRDCQLLEHSIAILSRCLDLAPSVAAAYASAKL